MKLNLYNQHGSLKATISPADNSTHQFKLMSENTLNLSFVLPHYLELDVNDYVDFDGQRFTLMSAYKPTLVSTQEYKYDPKFYGIESECKKALMLKTIDDELETSFSLYGTPQDHLDMVVKNINRIKGEGAFTVGTSLDAEPQNIVYNNVSCYEALNLMAQTFETEWWINGNTVNLIRCEMGSSTVELGYHNGLLSLSREDGDNVPFFTRLFPLGATRNIARNDYGFSRLQLPGVNGERPKYVERNLEYGIVEATEETAFSHIYPKRIGLVGEVREEEHTGENDEPFTIYYFKDKEGLDFDPNEYEIEGLVKHIVFQSGNLNGQEFEVNFNSDTQEFEIITQFPYENQQLPGGSLIPVTGNEYILYNIKMPQTYYRSAEKELKEAVEEYLEKYSQDVSIYKGDTDYIELEKRNILLAPGQRVSLQSETYFGGQRDSRVVGFTRKINNKSEMNVSFSNAVGKGRVENIETDISKLKAAVAKQESTAFTILKSYDVADATDYNVYSAVRSNHEFLSKKHSDSAQGLINFKKGAEFGDFSTGSLGGGAALHIEPGTGRSYLEVDDLMVRMKAVFNELVIKKLSHVGGEIVLTPARMKCIRVETRPAAYRCFFNTGEKVGDRYEVEQEFVVNDLARCQVFTGNGTKFYWRRVVGIGEDYIDLSISDAMEGSDIPEEGDEIVQLGNSTDKSRQSAIILSSYGKDTPAFVQYKGITNDWKLADREVTRISAGENVLSGRVNITQGSTGWQNFVGLPDEFANLAVGSINLLRNTGFTGDYQMISLNRDSQLTNGLQTFSPQTEHWTNYDTTVQADPEATLGYSAKIGTISQPVKLITDESYLISFKAKGTGVTVSCGNFTQYVSLTSGYERKILKFTALANSTSVTFTGDCTICDIKLERGTLVSDYSASPLDNDPSLAQYEASRYLSDAIRNGSVDILGGLILSSILQVGNHQNNQFKEVTGGLSGIYNDKDDVGLWLGGTLKQAMNAVMNPNQTTDVANAVITHGGKAILNDAVVRGTVYAKDGEFTGKVTAKEGEFHGEVSIADGKIQLNTDGSGQLADGGFTWSKDGRTSFKSMGKDGYIEMDSENNAIRLISESLKEVAKITFGYVASNERQPIGEIALNFFSADTLCNTLTLWPFGITLKDVLNNSSLEFSFKGEISFKQDGDTFFSVRKNVWTDKFEIYSPNWPTKNEVSEGCIYKDSNGGLYVK